MMSRRDMKGAEGEGAEEREEGGDLDASSNLFANMPYDHEDREADNIYEGVDEHMDERRKMRR
jgi:pre-mRNA-processing factor 6